MPTKGAKGQSGYGVAWLAGPGYGKMKELRTSTDCKSLT